MINMTTTAQLRVLDNSLKKDTDVEAKLDAMITAISSRVEKYLDRTVEFGSYTQEYDITDWNLRYRVDAYPVTDVTLVSNDDDDFDLVEDVYVDKQLGIVSLNNTALLVSGFGRMKIEYSGGMATDTADFMAKYPDLSYEVALQVLFEYGKMKNLVDKKTTIGEQTTERYDIGLQPSLVKMIKYYKRKSYIA